MVFMVRQRLRAIILCDAQENMGSGTAFHLAGCNILSPASGHLVWAPYAAAVLSLSTSNGVHAETKAYSCDLVGRPGDYGKWHSIHLAGRIVLSPASFYHVWAAYRAAVLSLSTSDGVHAQAKAYSCDLVRRPGEYGKWHSISSGRLHCSEPSF